MTRVILFAAICLSLLAGCKKSTKNEVQPNDKPTSYSNKIILDTVTVIGSNVKLTWTKLDTSDFVKYNVYRLDHDGFQQTLLGEITNKETTTFTDKDVPYSGKVTYHIFASLKPGTGLPSNIATYKRQQIVEIDAIPYDALYSYDDQLLYIFENTRNGSKVSICDLKTYTPTKTIILNTAIGTADFGVYNNKKELYIPADDGMIYIYNALTFEKISSINVGMKVASVAFSEGKLFVSTNNHQEYPLKVYNRADGMKIREVKGSDNSWVRKVPGTNTELINLSINSSNRHYYNFDTNGMLLNSDIHSTGGGHPFEPDVFGFFPDASKYVSSASGFVFYRNNDYQTKLAISGIKFVSFAFNAENKFIYAATNEQKIEVFSLTDLTHFRTIYTKTFPYKIFYTNSKIICLGKTEFYSTTPDGIYPPKLIVETVGK